MMKDSGIPRSCQGPGGYNHFLGSPGRRNVESACKMRLLRRKVICPKVACSWYMADSEAWDSSVAVTPGRDINNTWMLRAA